MVVPRILAGQALLDKLRYWVAVPLGAAAGAWLGYRIAQPGIGSHDVTMALCAAIAALWLGLSSPKPSAATAAPSKAGRASAKAEAHGSSRRSERKA